MEDNKTWVQALVSSKLFPNIPGSTVRVWGFDFKIYPGRKLCLKMDNDFVRNEVRAGRVKVMDSPPPGVVEKVKVQIEEPEPPKHKEITIEVGLPGFTMDVETYFGHGNMKGMIDSLSELTVSEIRKFALDSFEKTFPVRTTKDEILEQIRTMTDSEIVKIMAKREEEQEDE